MKYHFLDDKGTKCPGTNRPGTNHPGTKRPYSDCNGALFLGSKFFTSTCRGVHPPEAIMHFPLFHISLCFRNNFKTPWKLFQMFFSHQLNILNFPLFSLFQYIFRLFRENYYFFPTFLNFPLFSYNLRVFHILYVFFVSP